MAARRLLGQILKDHGAIHEGMVQEALMQQRDKGGRIGEILLELGHIQKGDLAKAIAEQAGLVFLDLAKQGGPCDSARVLGVADFALGQSPDGCDRRSRPLVDARGPVVHDRL